MSWTVTLVPLEALDDIWATAAPLLEKALPYTEGRLDLAAVREQLEQRRYLLWVAYPEDKTVRAAFVTRVASYPRRALLSVDLCGGGGLAHWGAKATEVFRAFAMASGLDGVELYGRAGWQRALRRYGWNSSMVLCELNV